MNYQKAEQLIADAMVHIITRPDGRIMVCNEDCEAMAIFEDGEWSDACDFMKRYMSDEEKQAFDLLAKLRVDAFEDANESKYA